MAREYDVVVIGSGSAGYSVASKCREAGMSVALVESRGFGGTCPLRVEVNEFLQSVSNPSVYAGGDAATTPYPLTPMAYLQGRVAALNIIQGNKVKVDYTGIPHVVYSIPPLASVGLSEDEARKQGLEFEKIFADTSSYFSTTGLGVQHSWMKVLYEKNSRRILGAHILAPHAEETINIFGLAMRHRLTVDDLKEAVWAYPSSVSDIAYVLG